MKFDEQVEYISSLKDGWHDGQGRTLDKDSLNWFAVHIKHYLLNPARIDEAVNFINGCRVLEVRGMTVSKHVEIREDQKDKTVILPYVYAKLDSDVRAEWLINTENGKVDLSLDVDIKRRIGYWHELNLKTDETEEKVLDLTCHADWLWLVSRLFELGAIEENVQV